MHTVVMMQRKPRDVRVILRVREEERKRWKRAAAEEDMTLSDWMRRLANEAAPKPRRAKR